MSPQLLVLSHDDVHKLLPVSACIAVMREALAALARGEVLQPLRSLVRPPGAPGFLGLMPAHRGGDRPAFGLKAVCVFPENPKRGLDTHVGVVILYSGETGEPLAVINASAITAIRTAAVSGVATDLLAREDASTLGILGAGVQARAHLEAMVAVRPIRRIRIYAPSSEQVNRMISETKVSVESIEAMETAEAAVRAANIIVTATSSRTPVLAREWISNGTHINAVGSSVAGARELDSATVAAARLFVDRRESTVNESGDYLLALREGAITEDHIVAEIGELLIGIAAGRRSLDEITLFKSLGLAIEDLATADALYLRAKESGAGTWIEF